MIRRVIDLIVIMLLLATTPLLAQTQKVEEQKQRMNKYKQELAKAAAEVEKAKKEKSSASKQVNSIEREMRLREGYISEVEEERRGVEQEMAVASVAIDSLSEVLATNREIYAEAIRTAHRNYTQNNATNYLLASSSIADAARRKAQIEYIATSRKAIADSIAQQSERLDARRMELSARGEELDSLSNVLKDERKRLESSRKEARAAYNKLSQREQKAINEKRKQQKLYDDAVKELQKMLKGNKVGAGFTRNTKGLNLPVDGGTLTEMGFGGTVTGKRGADVKTIYEGIVQDIQYKKLTNRYTVFMGYNEYLVTYTNLGSVSVKKGDVVKKDQKIGTIGNGIESDDAPFVRIAIYDCETQKPLTVSSFFKKK